MLARRVMVYVYGEFLIEAFDPGAGDIRTLNYKDRIIFVIDRLDVTDIVRSRQTPIGRRNIAVNNDLGGLAQRPEYPAEAKGRPNTVAIGFDVRRYTELLFVFN
jgi:hypothetical protein